jgi:hypothetical protein
VSRLSGSSASVASFAGAFGAVLLPKCPLCFVAYGSALGALGLSPAGHQRLWEALLVIAVAGSVAMVSVLAWRRRDVFTALFSLLGAALILAGRFAFDRPAVTAAGAAVLVTAAIVNSVLCRRVKMRARRVHVV